MRRQTPFADIVAHLTPFFVTRQIVCGAGRVGIGQDGAQAGLPDLPAGRLLRGRGRPGDDAQAADHQHPRRAARRRRQVPPAARHHRRRQPVRDLHLPQGRHDRAGAGHDRGEGARRRPGHRRPGRRAAGGQPRPDAEAPDAAARRPPAHRAGPAVGVPASGPASFVDDRYGADVDEHDRATCWTAGRACWTGSAATRCSAPTSWTGWPSCGCWRATGSASSSAGRSPKLQLVDLQYSDVRPEKGLYHRLVARGRDEDAARPTRRSGAR